MKKLLLLLILAMGTLIAGAQYQLVLLDEDFENGIPSGWTLIDNDNDGNGWDLCTSSPGGHESSNSAISYSVLGGSQLSPDNWIITPAVTLGASGNLLTFWRCVGWSTYAEHYGVYVSTTSPTDLSSFTLLYEETPVQNQYAWRERTVNLDAYANSTVYIAIRHFNVTNTNVQFLALDDITVSTTIYGGVITATPNSLDFGLVSINQPSAPLKVVTDLFNITGAITATVPAPFSVSVDNVNYGSTATMATDTFYVRYQPSMSVIDSADMVLTCGTATTTVKLRGEGVDCGNMSLPYTQDFETVADYTIPSCWSQISPFEGYPAAAPTTAYSGSKSLMFRSYNDPIYAVMPKMAADFSTLLLDFETRRQNNNSGTLSVGYVTDPTDASTFVTLWTATAAQMGNNNYQHITVSFGNVNVEQGEDYYIAFRYVSSSAFAFWYVDNIVVDEIPTCQNPYDLTSSVVTSTTATLSWNGNANDYFLYYRPSNTTTWTEIPYVTLDGGSYTLEGLTPATSYQWYVAADCSDTLLPSQGTASFTTSCATYTAPFSQDFNASSSLPSCWTKLNGLASDAFAGNLPSPTTGGWNFTNSYAFGYNHARLNVYGTSICNWLVTPAIDLSALESPGLTFDLALTHYNSNDAVTAGEQPDDKFMVLISTDYGATWSAANATIWSNDGSGNYVFDQIPATGQEITIPLTQFADSTIIIAFYGESTVQNTDNDIHVDNVLVGEYSTCTKPTGFSVVATTNATVTIDWTEAGSATSWNVQYGPTGFNLGDSIATVIPVSNHPYTVNGLTTLTDYDFYVQANCGDNTSIWVGPVTGTPGTFNMSVYGTDTLTTCSALIFDDGGAAGNYSSGCQSTLVLLPEIAGNSMAVYGTLSTEACCDYLRVYDGISTSSDDLLGEFKGINQTIPLLISSTGPLTLLFHSDGGIQNTGFSLTANCLSCLPPTGLSVDSITDNSAVVTWDDRDSVSSWMISYKAENDTIWTEAILADTFLVLTNLSATTTYEVRVSTDCGTEYSMPISQTFSTLSTPILLPYNTDFSDTADQQWVLNNGACANYWVIGSENNTPALFITNNGYTPSYTTGSNVTNVTAEKSFTVGTASTFIISFDVKVGGEANFDYMKAFFAPADTVYEASTPTNPAYSMLTYDEYAINFTDYLSYTQNTTSPYAFHLTQGNTVHVVVSMPNPNVNPTSESTAKLVFAWHNDHSGGTQPGAVIYNVSVTAASCEQPTNLAATSITTNGATLTWSSNSQASAWNVEYREYGATSWQTATASTNSITLSGLTPGTTYEMRVQADCGDDQSLWTTGSFSTDCDVITTFPYLEDFENGNPLPSCWTQEIVTGQAQWTLHNGNHSNLSAHSGTHNALFYYEASGHTAKLITPVFDITGLNSPYISFWHSQRIWVSDQDRLTVYYRTSATAEWQQLAQYTNNLADWTFDSLPLPNPSATYQLAFEGAAEYGYGVTLDDITIAGTVVTVEPTVATNAATYIAQTTATLNGTVTNPENATITAKGFEWKAAGAANYTVVNVTGDGLAYVLSNLTPNTSYVFKAFIIYNGNTLYGEELTFNTLPDDTPEPCEAPTNLEETGEVSKSVGLLSVRWTDNAGASQWNLQHRLQGTENWTTVVVTGQPYYASTDFEADATYELRVQAVCDGGVLSDWSNTLTAVATGVGINSWLENSVTLYPNPANDVVNVQCTMNNVQIESIEVFDVYGKLLQTVSMTPETTTINVSGLAAGMYFVRVTTDGGTATKSFVKK